jgi:exopolysaccharide biosynthesis protein
MLMQKYLAKFRAVAALALGVGASVILCGCGHGASSAQTIAETWKLPSADMPLGPPNAAQSVTTRTVTTGVTYYHIQRGSISASDFWTVNVGFYPTEAAAQNDVHALATSGITTRFDPSAGTNLKGNVLGYYLSVGKYKSQADATAAAERIAQATSNRYKPAVRDTALSGNPTTGPWLINVLAIKPSQTTATLAIALAGGNNLGGDGETVSAAARRLNALAAMNGGFFTNINPFKTPLPPRSPVGTTVHDGKLVGTAAGGRPAVMITKTSDGHPKVTILPKLTTRVTLSDSQGMTTDIKSIDRPILGAVVSCGAPAEAPTTSPAQDYVCTNDDDLVMYDDLYLQDKASNSRVDPDYKGATYELVVDATGTVTSGHAMLGAAAPPSGGYVLQGLGRNARWLQEHAAVGTKLTVSTHLYSNGKEMMLTPGVSIIEAGPTLSTPDLTANAAAEGFSPNIAAVDNGDASGTPNQSWYEGWYVDRSGRTDIGVAADGTILLVEIDGRQPDLSLGTTIPETAAVMKWLGAVSAISLDGGGSSNMVVGDSSVGHPSDSTGERGVGDTLVILPN